MADYTREELLAEARRRGLVGGQEPIKAETIPGALKEAAVALPVAIGRGAAGPIVDYPAAAIGMLTSKEPTTFGKELKDVKDINKEIESKSPAVSLIGKVVGAAGPLAKGQQLITKGLQAAGVGKGLASVAGSGALSGMYGAAQKIDKPKQVADELLKDIAIGFGAGAVGEYGPGIAKAGIDKVSQGTKRLFSSFKGINPETVTFYANNRVAVNNAIKQKVEDLVPDLATRMTQQLDDFISTKNSRLDELVRNSDKMVDAGPVMQKAWEIASDASKVASTQEAKNAVSALNNQLKILADQIPADGQVTASTLHTIKKQLQNSARAAYENKAIGVDKLFPEAVAKIANVADTVLDTVHPEIKGLNQSLSDAIKLQQKLGVGDIYKGGLDAKKARELLASNLPDRMANIKALDKLAGTQWGELSKLYKTVQDLKDQDVLSSFKTGRALLGVTLGAGAGSSYGGTGAGLGGLLGLIAQTPVGTRNEIMLGKGLYNLATGATRAISAAPVAVPAVRQSLRNEGR